MQRYLNIQVQACGCTDCRERIAREFFQLVDANWSANDLVAVYGPQALQASLLIDVAASGSRRILAGAVA